MAVTEKKNDSTKGEKPLFVVTGNPFVDSGIAAICVLTSKKEPSLITREDVEKSIDTVLGLYTIKAWRSNIQGVIFLNAVIGNPAVKEKVERYGQVLSDLLDKSTTIGSRGTCVTCGLRNGISVTRSEVPLLGSKKLVNFFASGRKGELFCPACILATQFLPVACEKVGKAALLLSTSDWNVMYAYVKQIVDEAIARAAKKEGGLVSLGYQRGPNAIFAALSRIITDPTILDMHENFPSLRFYHFTNFGQSPDVTKYDLPSNVFDFLVEVHRSDWEKDWAKIVSKGYKRRARDEEKTPFYVDNFVYIKLLEGRSIVSYFIDNENRVAIGCWQLLEYYLRKVRNMDEERIETIKRVADLIFEFSKERGDAKRILQIDRARKYPEFRQILLRINKGIVKKTGKSLLTFDEFVGMLAPEGGRYWRETRDLLLFRIYEVGSDWLQEASKEVEVEETEEE